jgi:tetratricopeptide (TPR) repeat protein
MEARIDSDDGSDAAPSARAEELFLGAVDQAPDARAGWLAAQDASAEDRADASRMLAAFEASAGRVDSAMVALREELRAAIDGGVSSAGRYVLLHRLGAGGFGEVYLGRQERPVRRLVAVKLLRDPLASADSRLRFRAEQQAVAALDHPGIAGMLDSGELPDGRPWFSMPFVPGVPITDHARAERLDPRGCVRLVVQACDAVEHAHRRGVIHRDLKPSNILVDGQGRAPRARIIDFGVAKLVDESFRGSSANTSEGAMVGTPEYMSPEQAESAPPDTRGDVFSLGVVLHELLAGRLPRSGDALRAGGRAGLAAAIRANAPLPPSATSPEVDRDLDAIARMACAADASERYQSAAELREDLLRWLGGELPVAARASGLARARRWAWRNRLPVGAAAAVLVALVAATAVSARSAFVAREALAAAQRRADQNARVLEFVSGVLAGADPTEQEGRGDVTVREKLAAAVRELDGGAMREAPVEAAEIRRSLAAAFAGLGRTDDAITQYLAALELLGAGRSQADELECALAIGASSQLANAQRGKEAVVYAERALAAARRAGSPASGANALSALADALRTEAQDLERAKRCALESVAILRAVEGVSRDDLAAALNNLGLVHFDLGELDRGISTTEEAIAIGRETGKSGTYKAMFDLHNLAQIERTAGRLDDAERHAREALAIVERLAGMDHPHRATIIANLALAKRSKKEFAEAESLQREGLRVLEAAGQGRTPDAGIAWLNLASILRDQEKFAEAADAGARAVEVIDGVEGSDPWLRAAARMSLGRALTASKRFVEAESPLKEAWALLEPLGIDPKRRSSGLLALYQLYRAWNAADAAACPATRVDEWRDRVRAFDAEYPGAIPPNAL